MHTSDKINNLLKIHINSFNRSILDFPKMVVDGIIMLDPWKSKNQMLLVTGKNAIKFSNEILKHNIYFDKILIVQAEGYYNKKILNDIKKNVLFFESTHPIISDKAIENSNKVISELISANIIHILITGGTSAIFAIPENGITLKEYQNIVNDAMSSGLDIETLNSIRIYIDKIKGGKLSSLFNNKTIHTWVISDVISDNPAIVGSGPTVYSNQIKLEATIWLEQKLDRMNISIIEDLKNRIPISKGQNHNVKIIATRHDLLNILQKNLKNNNVDSKVLSYNFEGDYKKCASEILSSINKVIKDKDYSKTFIFSGEPTVDTRHFEISGKGGRVSQIIYYISEYLKTYKVKILIIGIATDGQDGSSPHPCYYTTNFPIYESNFEYSEGELYRGNTGRILSENGFGLDLSRSNINFMDIYLFQILNCNTSKKMKNYTIVHNK